MSEMAREWMIQALSDFTDANTLIGAGSYSGSIIMAEQCVEKISKGLLLHTGTEFRFNQSVLTLAKQLDELGMLDSIERMLDDAKWITLQYALMRYPIDTIGIAPCKMASLDDAERAISCAKAYIAMTENVAPELLAV